MANLSIGFHDFLNYLFRIALENGAKSVGCRRVPGDCPLARYLTLTLGDRWIVQWVRDYETVGGVKYERGCFACAQQRTEERITHYDLPRWCYEFVTRADAWRPRNPDPEKPTYHIYIPAVIAVKLLLDAADWCEETGFPLD